MVGSRFDVGAAVARAARAWCRWLPVAVLVLGGCVALLRFWTSDQRSFEEATAAVGFGNIALMSWMEARLVAGAWPRFPPVQGLVAAAVCYVATGLLVSLQYRAAPGLMPSLRLLALGLIFGVGLTLGHLLLRDLLPRNRSALLILVPALLVETWVACRVWLLIPVIVIERGSLMPAVVRSFVLTRGATLRILALVLVLAAVPIGTTFVLDRIGRRGLHLVWPMLWGAGALATSLHASPLAATYRGLREARDGPRPASVAGVFD